MGVPVRTGYLPFGESGEAGASDRGTSGFPVDISDSCFLTQLPANAGKRLAGGGPLAGGLGTI
jgi:hypothetical protein